MLFFAIIFVVVVVLSFNIRAPRLVGDVHARLSFIFFYITVGLLTCRKVVFVGDIIDGPKGWPLWKSSLAIKLVRWCPWADCLMGNHEAYSVFSSNAEENASYWKEEVDEDGNFRPWTEWCNIRRWLTKGDVEWLKSRPLYIVGDGWFASHAKPVLPLPPKYVVVNGKPTKSQIELFDNTKEWFALGAPYCNSLGIVYVGHTPIQKLNNQKEWGKVVVLDGNAKKGGRPFNAVPINDGEFIIAIILMIVMALISISTSITKVEMKKTVVVMEEVTILAEVKKKPVVKKQVEKKQVSKVVAKKQKKKKVKVNDPVYETLWRVYKDKGGFLSKQYIRTRYERVRLAFEKVWGDEPVWQQQIAIAICTKETLCGVDIKFSEWDKKIFKNTNKNGSVDCGITQINSINTPYSCKELQNLEIAFREQRRIIHEKVRNKKTKEDWLKRIQYYNGIGPKAREYGRLIRKWVN